MILVCKDGRHACIVELDVFKVDSDKMNGRVARNERCKSIRDDL